jgi:hypothetical protein
MLITTNKIKSLLNISNTDNDNFIKTLIPVVEQDICTLCKNDFIDTRFDFISSNKISFNPTDNSLNLTGIESKDFIVGDTIRVYKSLRNDQIFTIDSIETNKLILNSIDEVTEENSDENIYIAKIKYPTGLKMIFAKMINYHLQENEEETANIKSEKMDDYSITYEDKSSGYPSSILSKLYNYRQLFKKDLFNSYKIDWGCCK